MNRALEFELLKNGATSGSELASALKVSQPTVSRRLAQLGNQIVRLGRGRLTLYALVREISPVGNSWPLYEINPEGRPRHRGILRALQAREWVLEQDEPWPTLRGDRDFPNGLYPDLPWFLDDLRPQGFLGRSFARAYGKSLHLSADPKDWNADDVLRALLQFGSDLPGAWVIGEVMLAEVQSGRLQHRDVIPESERSDHYLTRADAALAGEWPGSSAGGEQPKFTARVGGVADEVRHVIVKFSGNLGRKEDERWADLLLAEHVAASVLASHGIPASTTEVLRAGNRVFLESTRFDRVGAHGRRGMVSLLALDGAFFGEPFTPWTAAADRLEKEGWLSNEDANRLRILWWFGSLIGNTDMHYGNISLFLTPNRPLTVTPSYDMLPMLYRPDFQGNLPARDFAPPPPPPEAMPVWSQAIAMALEFWARLAEWEEISPPFREIARENRSLLLKHQSEFGIPVTSV